MNKYTIRSQDTEDSYVEVKVDGKGNIKAHEYNNYSRKTHNIVVTDDANGNVKIAVMVQGKTVKMCIPVYALFHLESVVRCMRDSYSGYGKRDRIIKGVEIE